MCPGALLRVHVVNGSALAVLLGRKDEVLRPAERELLDPCGESGEGSLVQRNLSPAAGFRLTLPDRQAPAFEVNLIPPQGLKLAPAKAGVKSEEEGGEKRAGASLTCRLEEAGLLIRRERPAHVVSLREHPHLGL